MQALLCGYSRFYQQADALHSSSVHPVNPPLWVHRFKAMTMITSLWHFDSSPPYSCYFGITPTLQPYIPPRSYDTFTRVTFWRGYLHNVLPVLYTRGFQCVIWRGGQEGGTGACRCSKNSRKLVIVVWPLIWLARQHGQQLELQQWRLMKLN